MAAVGERVAVRRARSEESAPGLALSDISRLYLSVVSRQSLGCLSATSRLPLGYLSAIARLPLGYLSATSRLPLGYRSAASRLPLGYLSATSRLPLGYVSAISDVVKEGDVDATRSHVRHHQHPSLALIINQRTDQL